MALKIQFLKLYWFSYIVIVKIFEVWGLLVVSERKEANKLKSLHFPVRLRVLPSLCAGTARLQRPGHGRHACSVLLHLRPRKPGALGS